MTAKRRPSRVWPAAAAIAGTLAVALPTAATEPRFPVVDLHVDLPYQVVHRERGLAEGTGQFRAADLLRAGVVGVVLPLFVPATVAPGGPQAEHYEASLGRMVDLLPKTRPYVPRACGVAPGEVATFFSFEGAPHLARAPESTAAWVERGVRVVGLVHARDNALASSSGEPEPSERGLTERGREVIERAYAAGAIVDVSHMSDRATADAIALAQRLGRPILATHSNARARAAHPRNLRDEDARGIAATGGVVGVNFHGPFVARGRPARLADVVGHIRHLVRVAGEDHVAIGSDFEGGIRPPAGLRDATGYPRLARALLAAGMSEELVRKVFAGNALRVLCPPAP
ncbi:MAG: membrane dipeptidase [Polyangiaceae bacterium]|nr:membrane dipeptidase [Polyangiaceae bacterium]